MAVAKEQPDLVIAGKSCHEWAGLYLGGERPHAEVMPANCAVLNEPVCHTAVSAAYHKSDALVRALVSYVSIITTTSKKPDGTEWTRSFEYVYGAAGFLYLLRLVKSWHPASAQLIDPAIYIVIEWILKNGPPWIYVERFDMLGPGHGDMGIIFQVVRSDPSYATHPAIRKSLLHLLDQQLENGNWLNIASDAVILTEPMTRPRRQLVQWCHGAPGIVQCLVLLRPHFLDLAGRIDAAIEKGRAFTWKEGLLTKEPNLCHGITGNAFAFPPGPQRDHFLSFTTEEEVAAGLKSGRFEKCDYGISYSLGFGAPGRAVGWLFKNRDAAKEQRGCYLSFDDI